MGEGQQTKRFDFIVLPLIYLEAFVVNILMNANIDVPDRVRIK